MAIGSGLGAQLGIAPETTYGTYVAPTKFVEFTKESLLLKKTTVQSAGIAAGRLLPLSSRRVVTQRQAAGSIDMEVTNKGMGLLLQSTMGTTVTPVQQDDGDAYLQTHVLADTAGKSLSIQVGVPLTTGVVTRKNFLGCKVLSAEFTCEVGGLLMASFEIDSKDVSEAETLAAASYAAMSPFHFGQMGVLAGAFGTETALNGVRKMSVKFERPQATDRFYANAAMLKAEPITNDQIKISGSIDIDYTDTVLDNLHTSDAEVSLVWEFLGPDIDTGVPETFRVLLPAIKVDDAPPTVDGFDVVKPTFNFTGLYDGSHQPSIEYISTDTAL